MRAGKLKNGKVVCKHEITGEMIKGRGDTVVDWNRSLYNMAFESSVVPEDYTSVKERGLNIRTIEVLVC